MPLGAPGLRLHYWMQKRGRAQRPFPALPASSTTDCVADSRCRSSSDSDAESTPLPAFFTFLAVSPFPGQHIDSVRAVLTVSDSIRADRSKSTITNGYNHDWDCGMPYYPGNSCIELSGSTMITLR